MYKMVALFVKSFISFIAYMFIIIFSENSVAAQSFRPASPQLAKKIAHLYWPSVRPDWCDKDVHFCISSEDSANFVNAYKVSVRFTRSRPVAGSSTPDAKLDEACDNKYFAEKRTGLKASKAIVVKSAPHWKTHRVILLCQPLPIDDAVAWKFQYGPGTHAQTINISARYPVIITGGAKSVKGLAPPNGPRIVDNRPFIDCTQGRTVGDHSPAGKACISGRENTDVTIVGLKVRLAYRQPNGSWKARGDQYYRCVRPGTGKLTMTDTDLINCKHGVQSGEGTVWEFIRVRMENCSFLGNGKAHCIYSSPPGYVGDPPHQEIIVKDSYLQTCGGHVIKSNSNKTIVRNSRLVEGAGKKCDTGNAIHNNAAMSVELENVVIEQSESKGNTQVFSVGSGIVKRCRGKQNGEWTLKNVTIKDTDPRPYRRYKENCPGAPAIWTDLGGNTINGAPLFDSRGVPFKRK